MLYWRLLFNIGKIPSQKGLENILTNTSKSMEYQTAYEWLPMRSRIYLDRVILVSNTFYFQ